MVTTLEVEKNQSEAELEEAKNESKSSGSVKTLSTSTKETELSKRLWQKNSQISELVKLSEKANFLKTSLEIFSQSAQTLLSVAHSNPSGDPAAEDGNFATEGVNGDF